MWKVTSSRVGKSLPELVTISSLKSYQNELGMLDIIFNSVTNIYYVTYLQENISILRQFIFKN